MSDKGTKSYMVLNSINIKVKKWHCVFLNIGEALSKNNLCNTPLSVLSIAYIRGRFFIEITYRVRDPRNLLINYTADNIFIVITYA